MVVELDVKMAFNNNKYILLTRRSKVHVENATVYGRAVCEMSSVTKHGISKFQQCTIDFNYEINIFLTIIDSGMKEI